MDFKGFRIHAVPHIIDAYCKCGERLQEVSNGLLSTAMFCEECHSVYALKLVKVHGSGVSKQFIQQALDEVQSSRDEPRDELTDIRRERDRWEATAKRLAAESGRYENTDFLQPDE